RVRSSCRPYIRHSQSALYLVQRQLLPCEPYCQKENRTAKPVDEGARQKFRNALLANEQRVLAYVREQCRPAQHMGGDVLGDRYGAVLLDLPDQRIARWRRRCSVVHCAAQLQRLLCKRLQTLGL